MEAIELREQVLAFLDLAIDSLQIEKGDGDWLSKPEILQMWSDLPDCQLTPMFIGYSLAKGYDINVFTPEDLALAVKSIVLCDKDSVEFDWLGGCDATDKPH